MDLKMYKDLNVKAKKYILKELKKKFYQKYDDEDLLKRCYLEIDLLFDKGFLFIIEYLYKFKKKYNEMYYFEGTINNLLILYILDINKVNPIDYNLPYELFNDIRVEVHLIYEHPFSLCWYLENKLQNEIKVISGKYEKEDPEIDYLYDDYYLLIPYDYCKSEIDIKFTLNEYFMFETAEDYRKYNDEFLMIKIDNKDLIKDYSKKELENVLTTEFEIKVAKILKPKTIKDYIKIECLAHGTNAWCNNQEELVKQGKINIDELITSREDVYEYLLNHSISKELALEITNFVRKGRAKKDPKKWNEYVKMMKKYNCEDMIIDIFSNILFIIGRGQAVSDCLYVLDDTSYYPKNNT